MVSRKSSTPYLRSEDTCGCTSSLDSHGLPLTFLCQSRPLRGHDPLYPPTLHLPPPFHLSDANLLGDNHHRSRERFVGHAVELAQTPAGSIDTRHGQLSRDAEHDRRRELTVLLPDRLGLDQGACSPCIPPSHSSPHEQPWFDEGTRNKIFVLGKDPGPTLRNLIDPQDLPKPYGGELEWKYEDEPSLDAPVKEAIGEMPRGPAVFLDGKVVQPPPKGRAAASAGQPQSQA